MATNTSNPLSTSRKKAYIALIVLLLALGVILLRLFLYEPVRIQTDVLSPDFPQKAWVLVKKGKITGEYSKGEAVLFLPIPGEKKVIGHIIAKMEDPSQPSLVYYGIWPGSKATAPQSADSLWWCSSQSIDGRVVGHIKMPF